MINKFTMTLAAAAVALLPGLASAVTITVDDLGQVGEERMESASGVVAIVGETVGAFTVSIASGVFSSPTSTSYELNTTSIETAGIGTLQITVEETGLSGFPSYPTLNALGSASISEIGENITVEHFLNFGAGYALVGSTHFFDKSGGISQASQSGQSFANASPFDMRTVVTIVNTAGNETSNVNATLIASVPVPAAGLLLLGALGGIGALRRRKKA